jgi:hypothetical protein
MQNEERATGSASLSLLFHISFFIVHFFLPARITGP